MVMLGCMVGAMLTSVVGRWIALVLDTLKGPTLHPRRIAALISLFHAGPWMLVVVAVFGYFEHSKQWAQLLGVGIVVWPVLFAFLMYRVRAAVRKRQEEKQNAV